MRAAASHQAPKSSQSCSRRATVTTLPASLATPLSGDTWLLGQPACLQDAIIDEFAAKTERSHIIKHFGAQVQIFDNAFTGFLDISMDNLKT